jgi:hypothetical protein
MMGNIRVHVDNDCHAMPVGCLEDFAKHRHVGRIVEIDVRVSKVQLYTCSEVRGFGTSLDLSYGIRP